MCILWRRELNGCPSGYQSRFSLDQSPGSEVQSSECLTRAGAHILVREKFPQRWAPERVWKFRRLNLRSRWPIQMGSCNYVLGHTHNCLHCTSLELPLKTRDPHFIETIANQMKLILPWSRLGEQKLGCVFGWLDILEGRREGQKFRMLLLLDDSDYLPNSLLFSNTFSFSLAQETFSQDLLWSTFVCMESSVLFLDDCWVAMVILGGTRVKPTERWFCAAHLQLRPPQFIPGVTPCLVFSTSLLQNIYVSAPRGLKAPRAVNHNYSLGKHRIDDISPNHLNPNEM